MLKITYSDTGLYLEHLEESLETWLARRVLLCLRAATSIYVEPSTASVLFPGDLLSLKKMTALTRENNEIVSFVYCDDNSVEVGLQGTWISAEEDRESGIFVCALSDRAEKSLYQLWEQANLGTSLIGE